MRCRHLRARAGWHRPTGCDLCNIKNQLGIRVQRQATRYLSQSELLPTLPSPTLEALESLDLPTPPGAVLAFLQAAAREDASMDEMAELVRREPALTARILTVANSAAFRAPGEPRSLKQSMQVLGLRTLHSIAASIAVREAFSGLPGARADDFDGFWRHSLMVAELAQAIAVETGQADPEEAYLAGLLHDVGELLLLGGLQAGYGRLLGEAAGAEAALVALEKAALQTDHAVVGAWLVDRWRLPSFMADALLFHHHRLEEVALADPLTRVLWAAHKCHTLAAQPGPDPDPKLRNDPDPNPDPAGFESAAHLVGLPAMQLARTRPSEMRQRYRRASRSSSGTARPAVSMTPSMATTVTDRSGRTRSLPSRFRSPS